MEYTREVNFLENLTKEADIKSARRLCLPKIASIQIRQADGAFN